MRLTSLVAFALIALLACVGYRGIREPLLTAYNGRWQRRLERTARRDLGCRSVRMIPLSDTVLQADGCNRVAEYGLFCLGSRDCDWRAFEPVATRAERDLSCPSVGLSVTATSALERQIYGCGRIATYVMSCAPQHCAWTPAASAATVAPIDVVAITASSDDAVIPPPPGAGGEVAIPPPPGASISTDDAVIPPPPR